MKKLIGVLLVFLLMITPVYAREAILVQIPVTMQTGDGKTHQVTISSLDAPVPDQRTLKVKDGQKRSFVVALTKLDTFHYTLKDDLNEIIHVQVMVSHDSTGKMVSTIIASNKQNKKISTISFPAQSEKSTTTTYNDEEKPTAQTTTDSAGGTTSKSKSDNTPTEAESTTDHDKTKTKGTSPDLATYLSSRFVKTGDGTQIVPYICAFVLAVLTMIVLIAKKRKKKSVNN